MPKPQDLKVTFILKKRAVIKAIAALIIVS